jgi:chemotaxis protein methyltransferase CheR
VTEPLDPAALSDVAIALRRAAGIVFSDTGGYTLRAGFAAAAAALRLAPQELLERLRARDAAVTQVLVESSVVGETYFGRHPEQLEALRAELRTLPKSRPVTLWSAGCATGEEAYTLAILLLEEGRRDGVVVGTDVSGNALEIARRGRYGPWSLRGVAPLSRLRWLRPVDDAWLVNDEVRRMVRFERRNLLGDAPPGSGFDVVLCRNVLIYFDRPTIEGVVRRLFDAAAPRGVVALAPAEVPFAAPLGHARIDFRGGALWRKAPANEGGRSVGAGAVRGERVPTGEYPSVPAELGPGAPRSGTVSSLPAASGATVDPLERARAAASEGRWADAEREARAEGERSLQPAPFLFAAVAAESRGDLAGAAHWLGRALFLAPDHVVARASLIPILERMGRHAEADRVRRAALRELAPIPDEQLLPGVEPIAAGALRSALLAFPAVEVSE